jgi:hypothetical protein
MSAILDDFINITYSMPSGRRYGIKPFKSEYFLGLIYPVKLDTSEKRIALLKKAKEIYPSLALHDYTDIDGECLFLDEKIFSGRDDFFKKKPSIDIVFEDDFTLTFRLRRMQEGIPMFSDRCMLDILTRNTVVGTELTSYWKLNKRITEYHVSERLRKITPLADLTSPFDCSITMRPESSKGL